MINRCVPFILLPFLTHVLSPSGFGLVSMFQVCLSIYIAVVGLSLNSLLPKLYYEYKPDRRPEAVGILYWLCLASLFIIGILNFIFSGLVEKATGLDALTIGFCQSWLVLTCCTS